MRVPPLCSLAAVASGLVATEVGDGTVVACGTRDIRVGEERRQCHQDRRWYTLAQTLEFVYSRGGDMDFAMRMWKEMGLLLAVVSEV